MKITIITATKDTDAELRAALESVARQTYRDVEHLVIDSCDGERPAEVYSDFANVRYFHVPSRGVYAAINEGLRHATGEVIGLLHGNDRFAREDVLEQVAAAFVADPYLGFTFGDLQYFNPTTGRAGRIYASTNYHPSLLRDAYAPPHPTLYVTSKLARRVGPYAERYRISSDLDWWMRLFAVPGVRWKHLPGIMVMMSYGGMSTRLFNRLWSANREKLDILKRHNVKRPWWRLIKKYIHAIGQSFKSYQHS